MSFLTLFGYSQPDKESKTIRYIKKSMEYEFYDPEVSMKYCDSAFLYADENSDEQGRCFAMRAMLLEDAGQMQDAIRDYAKSFNIYLANKNYAKAVSALNGIGTSYKHKGNLDLALKKYFKALALAQKYQCKREESIVYDNIGIIYSIRGNEKQSLNYYLKSRKINEETADTAGLISSYNLIAHSFEVLEENDSAAIFLDKSLKLAVAFGDSLSIGDALNNLGYLTKETGDLRGALKYYWKCIDIRTKMHDYAFLSDAYDNAALSYMDLKEFDSAHYCMEKAMEIASQNQNSEEMAHLHISQGEYFIRTGDWNKAIEHLKKGYRLANENALYKDLKNSTKRLSIAYAAVEDYKNAYLFHVEFSSWNDSLNSDEKTKAMTRLSMQYDFDKQQQIQKLQKEKEDQEKAAELKRQQMLRNIFIIVAILLTIIGAIIFLNLKQSRKKNRIISEQKREVEHQKEIVEEKNKEILDSITYAKRLQEAILPPMKVVKEYLRDSFILYKPKDIVAGDFYFMESIDSKIIIAAADCTGHGVPGAMVSVVCANALNRAVKEFRFIDPGQILDKVRELVLETFSRSESEVKDGMDISLCVIDLKSRKLQWSGANNPLWIVRKEDDGHVHSLVEIKPDKQPIGKTENSKSFSSHSLDLMQSDTIYIFTDGYEDQFGGEKGKKFKSAKMKELFISIQDMDMDTQRIEINQAFENWKGDLEQVDDVCVIGIRI